MQTTFIAPDIECAGCAASIEKTLGRLPGVEAVSVDVPAKQITVRFAEAQTSRASLADALTEVGFPPQDS